MAIESCASIPGRCLGNRWFSSQSRCKFRKAGVNWHHDGSTSSPQDKNEQTETEPENFDIKILRELAADSKWWL